MTDREIMQQALEALENLPALNWIPERHDAVIGAITSLRERLAQPQMQPCAGRNCGSTNPNLHSAECFEDYEKSTGMNQWQGLTDEEIKSVCYKRDWTAHWTNETFARAIEEKLKEKNT